jgi:hypothetical protein
LASTDEERQQLALQHAAHMQLVFADRSTDDRSSKLSLQSCAAGNVLPGRLIKVDIDGMDQSKFRCPRNVMMLTGNRFNMQGCCANKIHLSVPQ